MPYRALAAPLLSCLACALLAGCLTSPEVEALSDVAPVEGPYPELAPQSALPKGPEDPERGTREAEALESRAAALRARAEALSARQP